MRQAALFIGITAALSGTAYIFTQDTRSEPEIVRDVVIACAINIGRIRHITELDVERCRREAGDDMETQQ